MFGIENRLLLLEEYTSIRVWIDQQTGSKPLLTLATYATFYVVHILDYPPNLAQGLTPLILHLGGISYIDELVCTQMGIYADELDQDYLEMSGDPDIAPSDKPEVARAASIARAAEAIAFAMQISLASSPEEMRTACAECIYCCSAVDGFKAELLSSIINPS